KGMLGFAITGRIHEKSDISYRHLYTSELVLVSSPDWAHKLEGSNITSGTLAQVPLPDYEEAFNYIQRYYAEIFKEDQISRPLITVEDLSIIHSLLCENAGYSVLPRYLVEADLAAGNLKQLLHPTKPPQYALYFLWNKIN